MIAGGGTSGGKMTRHGEALGQGLLLFLALGAGPAAAQQVQSPFPARVGAQISPSPLRQSTSSSFEITATVQDSCTISRDGSFASRIRCMGNTPVEAVYTMRDDLQFAMLTADQSGNGLARQVVFCDLSNRTAFGDTAFSVALPAGVYSTLEACF